MTDVIDDSKQKAILNSAFQAFAAYGFRKTSMEDIARGAGMSRPAVYLHYKNKEAIVRKLARVYYEEKTAAVGQALEGPGSVSQAVARAMNAIIDGMAVILASPHGLELLDTSTSMASDIVQQGEAELAGLFADWLRREEAAGRIRVFGDPDEVGRTITATLKGVKMTAPSAEEYLSRVAQLAAMIGAGLEVR